MLADRCVTKANLSDPDPGQLPPDKRARSNDAWNIIGINPVHGLKKPKDNVHQRRLSEAE